MQRPYSLPLVASFTLLVLLLAACSGSSDESADTTLASSTTEQATTTTTASTTTATTTTTAPTTTTTVAETSVAMVTETGLVYATFNDATLTLDMNVPAEPSGAPIVIAPATVPIVFWPRTELAEGLVAEGAIVVYPELKQSAVSPEEFLSDNGGAVRAMADQLACAIHFARERASELGSDDPIVALTGFSLDGGYSAHAALFGATLEARWDEFAAEGGPPRQAECEVTDGSTHVDAVVGMAGAYDVFVPIHNGGFGLSYQQERDPELQEFLSSSIGANPDLTVRLIHGNADVTINPEYSVEFAATLADAGYDVGEVVFFDGQHGTPPTEVAVQTIIEAIAP